MFTRIRKFLYQSIVGFNITRSASSQVAVFVFLLSSLSTIAIAKNLENQKLAQEREEIAQIADNYVQKIQENLEETLSATHALAALVNQYQGVIPNFAIVAQELLKLYPEAYALALLPHKSASEVVYAQDASKAIEPIELQCFSQEQKINLSKKVQEPILTESFPGVYSFAGSLGCLPVFFTNEAGDNFFWGFTSVIINYFQLLEDVDLEQLEARGLTYKLWYVNEKYLAKEIIVESANFPEREYNYLENYIKLPHVFWVFNVAPLEGWNKAPRFLLTSLFGVFISFLLAALVKLLLDSQVYASELEKIAYFDPLTTLPNRRFLVYRLEQIIAATPRNKQNTVICYLDLDDFQPINRRLGSKAGDYILVRIAKRLQKFLRVEDIIARIGGDEFAIILQNIANLEEAESILKRITEAIANPIIFDAEVIYISASIGVTTYPQDCGSVENLLRHANQAMNRSKKHHKGTYTLFQSLELTETQSLPSRLMSNE